MKKISSQILYNLKKDKSSFISFGIIILITALILSCAAVLLLQVDLAYDEKFAKLNTASVNTLVPEIQDSPALQQSLVGIDGIEKLERHTAILTEATVKDFNGTDFAMNTAFYNLNASKTLNNFELVAEIDTPVENPIYIPLFSAKFGGFDLHDKIDYVIDGITHTFTVAGIIEEMQYGNYGTSMLCAYLPQTGFDALKQELSGKSVTEYSLRLSADANLEKVTAEISKVLEDQGVTMLNCLDHQQVKQTRTQLCNLLILILAAFALIILAVSVFLSNFRIKNAIESEIINMSVLKSLGYTSRQIVACIALPYSLVTTLSALVGVGLSYLALPVLGNVLAVQSGFTCGFRFDWLSLVCVTAILVGVVSMFTVLSTRKIRKTQPIDGLRGNSGEKQSKKNRFPLESTRGNTQTLLVLKQMFACKKQNILLFLVSFVLTILTAFSGTLFYNVAMEPDNFMSALSDETPDVIIKPQTQCTGALENMLNADNRVEYALQSLSGNVKIGDKTITAFACQDFSKVRNDVCYKGRTPQAADEIALGSALADSYHLGDTVSVTLGDVTKTFLVTGYVQSVNTQGELCELSLEGYLSLCLEPQTPSLYVYLHNAADAESVTSEYLSRHPELVLESTNANKMQKETQRMYMDITVILVILIFVLTILIVLFILYIVIKSLLVKRRQELGIYKAMGYTSPQLIFQTAGAFLPVSIAAILLSSVAAMFYMPAIYQGIFGALGVMKNNIEISFGFLMLFAGVQIFVNFAISIFLCLPIRKISPYALIKE
jgi:putative ABC transport system permease protein